MAENIESKRLNQMVEVLNDLSDNELMQLFRDVNSCDGSYEFTDGWDMDEFLHVMIEGKKGSGLVGFIQDVAEAVNNYDGSDGIEDAMWGYFDGYTLEIKDERDIIEEAREDYLEDLANDVIEDGRTSKFSDLPGEVEDLLDQWDSEDYLDWHGAGDYVAWDGDTEVARKHFDDFDSYCEWTENDELSDCEFECVETDA